MPVVAVIAGLVAVVWGAIYARRGSLVVGCGLLVVLAYVLGHSFWHTKLGPVPVTLDRVALAGLLAAFVVAWRIGRWNLRPLTAADWALAGLLAVLAFSAATSGAPAFDDDVASKWGRLAAAFIIPTLVYLVARKVGISRREWSRLLLILAGLGIYLAVTGVLEVAGQWSLVFPRYIADPELGIHFGRARGPELNSVSLGCMLTAALCCTWVLATQVQRRWQQLALLAALPLITLGVFLTFTRSTWIGLAAGVLVIVAAKIPRHWRMPAVGAAALAGLLLLAASWSQLLGLAREGTAAEASHSVDQRASFAYVSWQMFRDHPVTGVGFGRFYDRKLPYLSDRSQAFELESLRPLVHHNTLLGVLTETGMVGLAALLAVLAVWTRCACRLVAIADASPHARAHGVLMLGLLANYLCSALFHDLTYLPSQHLLLFLFAGLTVNLRQNAEGERGRGGEGETPRRNEGRLTQHIVRRSPRLPVSPSPPLEPEDDHVTLFGIRIARLTMNEAVSRVLDWCGQPRGNACRYIVTPNVDHAVLLQQRDDLRAAYADASLVLADGAPIVLASRLLERPLPERVAGSDLVPELFAATRGPLRVFLLGAAPGVAEAAAARIERRWPNVKVVGTYSPLLGFENDKAENERIFAAIAAAAPDLLIVGLGAPKQELWVHCHRHEIQAKVAICAGATIDFLAGQRRRSPVWMRRAGMEWLHRLSSEPRRLAGRYARDAWGFPPLVWREWRQVQGASISQ